MFALFLFLSYMALLLPACISDGQIDQYSSNEDVSPNQLYHALRRSGSNVNTYVGSISPIKPNLAKNQTKWGTYMAILTNSSSKALNNIKRNLQNNYYLDKNNVAIIEELFKDVGEHESIVRSNLKKIIEKNQFNQSKEFMFSFMDMSNFLMAKFLNFNLEKLKLVVTPKWYNDYRNKIQRHELKAASNYVEIKICRIGVCKPKNVYSDFLKQWLRCILYMEPSGVNKFYGLILDILLRYVETLQTSVKFKATIFTIQSSDVIVQKDTFNILDEVILTLNRNNTTKLSKIPKKLHKDIKLFEELFQIIDKNYDINKFNKEELEDISNQFNKLLDGDYDDIYDAMVDVMENIKKNLKIWPVTVQSRLFVLWSEIINLGYKLGH